MTSTESRAATLADFLLARIAEDEAVARAASARPAPDDADAVYVTWRRDDTGWVPGATGEWVEGSALAKRWDPARVLAECEAKRRIVGQHRSTGEDCPVCTRCNSSGPEAQGWPCDTVLALALPYADHPDYRQEWAA